MGDERQKEIIDRISVLLQNTLKPKRIILFGSRAKGSHTRHADFDFALDAPPPDISAEREIREKMEEIGGLYKFDLVFLDSIEEDFKKIILRTGKVLYEKR